MQSTDPSRTQARRRRSHLPGLQPQRTSLAWDRTAMALLANGALLALRDAGTSHPFGLTAAIIAGLLATMCSTMARSRAQDPAGRPPASGSRSTRPAIAVLAAGVMLMAALELTSALRA